MDTAALNPQLLSMQLFVMLINSAIVTALLAVFSLSRYSKAVLRGMQSAHGAPLELPEVVSAPIGGGSDQPSGRLKREQQVHRRVIGVYLGSVAISAIPLSWAYLASIDLVTPMHMVMWTSIACVAAVPMIAVSLSWPWWRGTRFAILLLLAGAGATTIASMLQRLARGAAPGLDQLANVGAYLLAAATLLSLPLFFILTSGVARVRGIVPTIFATLMVFGMSAWLGMWLASWLVLTDSGFALVLSSAPYVGLYGPFLVLALPMGWLAWRRVHALARRYEDKRLSDVQILARMWWLIYVSEAAIVMVNEDLSRTLIFLAASTTSFFLFIACNAWLFRVSGLVAGDDRTRTLLLLRVFGHRKRTEKLFDRIGARWRYFGPISLIAAPDVVARTVDPGDFLAWLNGRVDETFVRSREDLERRLAQFDARPDPDGRYRVNEFCCHDHTWQRTVASLMARADAIVMDVRGLAVQRAGIKFELDLLCARTDPGRVVLIVEKKTDRSLLRPTNAGATPPWHVVEVERGSSRENDVVFETLLRAAR